MPTPTPYALEKGGDVLMVRTKVPAERLEDIDRRLEALLESLLRISDLIDPLPPLPPGKPARPPVEKRHLELVSKRAA